MTGPVVLQACSQDGYEYINQLSPQFIQAFTCTYVGDIGLFVAGLFVWGAISLAIYTKQGSIAIPLVLLFQFGGVVVSQIAGVATPVIVLVLVMVPAGIGALLYYRYSL